MSSVMRNLPTGEDVIDVAFLYFEVALWTWHPNGPAALVRDPSPADWARVVAIYQYPAIDTTLVEPVQSM